VARSVDQELVEACPAQRADEAFHDRVRPRCPDRGADDADVGAAERRVEAGVNLLSGRGSRTGTGWRGRRGP
jgi:hypothetical protein